MGCEDVPWDEVGIEELFQFQHYPILRDAGGFLTRLRTATTVDRYPKQLWAKHLINELAELKGEPWDLEKAVRRGKFVEAQMILGAMLPALLRVAFLINRQYYPWRKYLFSYFKDLPTGPTELLAEFETIRSGSSMERKSAAVNRILNVLTEKILSAGILSAGVLEYLFDARSGRAWENPAWRRGPDLYRKKAKDAGCDWLDGWIWHWWKLECDGR